MFSFDRQITRSLHDEHLATIAVLERLEGLFQTFDAKKMPTGDNPEMSMILGDIISLAQSDVKNHFAFEEQRLFPLLGAAGDMPISRILTGEHEVILPLAGLLSQLAKTARRDGFTEAAWVRFRLSGMELIERMISHIQKEEMALLPMLEDIVEEDADGQLMMEYAAMR